MIFSVNESSRARYAVSSNLLHHWLWIVRHFARHGKQFSFIFIYLLLKSNFRTLNYDIGTPAKDYNREFNNELEWPVIWRHFAFSSAPQLPPPQRLPKRARRRAPGGRQEEGKVAYVTAAPPRREKVGEKKRKISPIFSFVEGRLWHRLRKKTGVLFWLFPVLVFPAPFLSNLPSLFTAYLHGQGSPKEPSRRREAPQWDRKRKRKRNPDTSAILDSRALRERMTGEEIGRQYMTGRTMLVWSGFNSNSPYDRIYSDSNSWLQTKHALFWIMNCVEFYRENEQSASRLWRMHQLFHQQILDISQFASDINLFFQLVSP